MKDKSFKRRFVAFAVSKAAILLRKTSPNSVRKDAFAHAKAMVIITMNNDVKIIPETNPQGYGPKKPEILDLAHRAAPPVHETVWKDGTKVIAFQSRLEDFYFMGIENKYVENSNFGDFWGNFFDKGGYAPMESYETDPNCINVWYNRSADERIYFQGKMVCKDAVVPDGYTMKKFAGGEYLVVTTEWMPTYEETMKHIKFEYFENTPAPDGYVKCTEEDTGVWLLERWGANTGEGYRYEFWVPLKCANQVEPS